MTTYVFQSVLRLKEKTCGCAYGISLEEPVYDLARELGIRGRYAGHARVSGECDLSLRAIEDNSPIGVIEIKKDPRNYWEDIARLSYLVRHGLEFGVLASYWLKKSRTVSQKKRMLESIREFEPYFLPSGEMLQN